MHVKVMSCTEYRQAGDTRRHEIRRAVTMRQIRTELELRFHRKGASEHGEQCRQALMRYSRLRSSDLEVAFGILRTACKNREPRTYSKRNSRAAVRVGTRHNIPARKEHPRTRSRLDNIEPSSCGRGQLGTSLDDHGSMDTHRCLNNTQFACGRVGIQHKRANRREGASCHIPWSKAAIPTMISTALPKEAFSRPDRV